MLKFSIFFGLIGLCGACCSTTTGTTLESRPGHMIRCQPLTNNNDEKSQWFLVTDEENVIFLDTCKKGDVKVKEENWKDVVASADNPDRFVRSCTVYKQGQSNMEYLLTRARKFLDSSVYFHSDKCNSEHWVRHWVSGKAYRDVLDSNNVMASKICFEQV